MVVDNVNKKRAILAKLMVNYWLLNGRKNICIYSLSLIEINFASSEMFSILKRFTEEVFLMSLTSILHFLSFFTEYNDLRIHF